MMFPNDRRRHRHEDEQNGHGGQHARAPFGFAAQGLENDEERSQPQGEFGSEGKYPPIRREESVELSKGSEDAVKGHIAITADLMHGRHADGVIVKIQEGGNTIGVQGDAADPQNVNSKPYQPFEIPFKQKCEGENERGGLEMECERQT